MKKDFILKGDICYSLAPQQLVCMEHGYLVCRDGRSAGVFSQVPEAYTALPMLDFTGQMIVPGLSDLHLHAPQFSYRGLGMDEELLGWLQRYAFPEEAKFADLDYARLAYGQFVAALRASGTTRFCAFGTIHTEGTLLLMDLLEQAGLRGYVGKVNMDRNSPDFYREAGAQASLEATVRWLDRADHPHVKPILTPRFTISCTDELMEGLGQLARDRGLRVQSHLSENRDEIRQVRQLSPQAENYLDTYRSSGLLDPERPAVMAHCVYSDARERAMMAEHRVFAVHCPQCNMNIASGIAPVRTWLDAGLQMGLGTDIAGGATLSVFRAMTEARQVSKLAWRLQDRSLAPLTLEEIFWMGTKGGGAFFGKVGSFEPGYELDALVLDERRMPHPQPLTLRQRLERFLCLSEGQDIQHKFIAGEKLF